MRKSVSARSSGEETAGSASGGALRWATALLALYAAVAATLAWLGAGGGQGGEVRMSAEVEAFFHRRDQDVMTHAKAQTQAELEGVRKAINAASDQLTRGRQQMESAVAGFGSKVDEMTRTVEERLSKLDSELRLVAAAPRDIATVRVQVEALQTKVKEWRPAAPAPPAPVGPEPASPEPAAAPAEPTPPPPVVPAGPALTPEQFKTAVEKLLSSDTAKAWEGAEVLGRSADLAAVPPLMKVLKDHKDAFIRAACAASLGKLHSCDAVPALLDAFLDKDQLAFGAAAQAYSAITDQATGLTAAARMPERRALREKWTKWWKENEEAVRAKWGQPKGGAPAPAGDAGGAAEPGK